MCVEAVPGGEGLAADAADVRPPLLVHHPHVVVERRLAHRAVVAEVAHVRLDLVVNTPHVGYQGRLHEQNT